MTDHQNQDQDTGSNIPENDTPKTMDIMASPSPARPSNLTLLIIGITFFAALFLGMAVGYGVGRSQSKPPVQVVVTATAAEAVAQAGDTPAQVTQQPTAASAPETADGQPTPTIMDFVLSDARHFQGSTDAPITVVEFSDFK